MAPQVTGLDKLHCNASLQHLLRITPVSLSFLHVHRHCSGSCTCGWRGMTLSLSLLPSPNWWGGPVLWWMPSFLHWSCVRRLRRSSCNWGMSLGSRWGIAGRKIASYSTATDITHHLQQTSNIYNRPCSAWRGLSLAVPTCAAVLLVIDTALLAIYYYISNSVKSWYMDDSLKLVQALCLWSTHCLIVLKKVYMWGCLSILAKANSSVGSYNVVQTKILAAGVLSLSPSSD